MEDLCLNQKYNNIPISYSLKYKHLEKKNSLIAITALDLSHVLTLMTLLFESMLSQMLKYAGNIMVKYVFSKSCCGKDFSKPLCES